VNDDDLFTGTDSARSTPAKEANPEQFPGPRNPLLVWLRGLTYDETHALTVGAIPVLTSLVLLPFVPEIALIPMAVGGFVGAASVVELTYPNVVTRYCLRRVHYVLGGHAVATLAGLLWVGFVAAVRSIATVVA